MSQHFNRFNLDTSTESLLAAKESLQPKQISVLDAKEALINRELPTKVDPLVSAKESLLGGSSRFSQPTVVDKKKATVLGSSALKQNRFSGNTDATQALPSLYEVPYELLSEDNQALAIREQERSNNQLAATKKQKIRDEKTFIDDSELDTFGGGLVNVGAAAVKGATEFAGTIISAPLELEKFISGLGITSEDKAKYDSILLKEATGANLSDADSEFKDSNEFAQLDNVKQINNVLKIIDDGAKVVTEKYNDKKFNKFIKEEKAVVADTITAYRENGIFDAIGTFLLGTDETVADNPAATVEFIASVIPQMIGMAKFAVTSLVALSAEGTNKALDDFVAEYGRQPDQGERAIAAAVSTAVAGLDILGAKVAVGSKKILEGAKKSNILKSEKNLKELSRKISDVKAGIKSNAPKGAALVADLSKRIIVEGGTEGLQSAGSQFAAKQDTSKIQGDEVLLDTALGMIAGGGLSAGVKAANKVAEVTKKGVTETSKVLENIKSSVNLDTDSAITKAEEAGTPEVAIEVLLNQNFDKMKPEVRKDNLQKLSKFIKQFDAQISEAKGTPEDKLKLSEISSGYVSKLSGLIKANNASKSVTETLPSDAVKTLTETQAVEGKADTDVVTKQTDAIASIVQDIGSNTDLPLEDAKKTFGSAPFLDLASDKDIKLLEEFIAYKESKNKVENNIKSEAATGESVNSDIISGKGKFKGVETHLSDLQESISLDNKDAADTTLNSLESFLGRQKVKLTAREHTPKIKSFIESEITLIEDTIKQATNMYEVGFGKAPKPVSTDDSFQKPKKPKESKVSSKSQEFSYDSFLDSFKNDSKYSAIRERLARGNISEASATDALIVMSGYQGESKKIAKDKLQAISEFVRTNTLNTVVPTSDTKLDALVNKFSKPNTNKKATPASKFVIGIPNKAPPKATESVKPKAKPKPSAATRLAGSRSILPDIDVSKNLDKTKEFFLNEFNTNFKYAAIRTRIDNGSLTSNQAAKALAGVEKQSSAFKSVNVAKNTAIEEYLTKLKLAEHTTESDKIVKDIKTISKQIKKIERDNNTIGQLLAKEGGLDRVDMQANGLGIEKFKDNVGVFSMPLFPLFGGMTLKDVTEVLNEVGISNGSTNNKDTLIIINELLLDDVRYVDSAIETELASLYEEKLKLQASRRKHLNSAPTHLQVSDLVNKPTITTIPLETDTPYTESKKIDPTSVKPIIIAERLLTKLEKIPNTLLPNDSAVRLKERLISGITSSPKISVEALASIQRDFDKLTTSIKDPVESKTEVTSKPDNIYSVSKPIALDRGKLPKDVNKPISNDNSNNLLIRGLTANIGANQTGNQLSTFVSVKPLTDNSGSLRTSRKLFTRMAKKSTRDQAIKDIGGIKPENEQTLANTIKFVGFFNKSFVGLSEFLTKEKVFSGDLDGSNTTGQKSLGNPFGYFTQIDSEGKRFLNENLVSTISLTVYDWLATQSSGTLLNSEQNIKSILGLKDSETVSVTANNEFMLAGSSKASLTDLLGNKIWNNLELTRKDTNQDPDTISRLKLSLGMMAVDTLLDTGLLKQTSKPSETMQLHTSDVGRKNYSNDLPTLFVRIPASRGSLGDLPAPIVQKVIDNIKDSPKFLSDKFGIASNATGPTLEASLTLPKTVKGTIANIPDKAQGIMKKMQKVPWNIKTNVTSVLNWMDEASVLELFGHEADLQSVHVTEEGSLLSKNRDIEKAYQASKDFIKELPTKDSKFYFSYEMWSNFRVSILSNTINPMATKMHRTIFGIANIDVSVNSPAKLQLFKLAVAQAFKVKIDVNDMATSEAAFSELLQDPDILAAVESIKSKSNSDAIVKVAKKYEEGRTLEGLIALSVYKDSGTFLTNIPIETDGITNGVAHTLMQTMYGANAESMLASAGVYLDPKYRDFSDWVKEPGNNDNYVNLAISWGKRLAETLKDFTEVEKNFLARITGDLINSPESDGRKLAKSPLMTAIYGASIKRIGELLAENAVKGFYSEMMATSNQAELDTFLTGFAKTIGIKPIRMDYSVRRDMQLTRAQQIAITNVINQTYGLSLSQELESKLEAFTEFRETINVATKEMFSIFKAFVDQAETKAIQDKNGVALLPQERDKILKDLLEVLPSVRTPMSQDTSDSFIAMNTELVRQYGKQGKQVQVKHSRPIKNALNSQTVELSKSSTGTISERAYTDPGITAPSFVQSMDSANVLDVMNKFNAMSVFDAVEYDINSVLEGTQLHNTSFGDIHQDYLLLEEVLTSVKRLNTAAMKDTVVMNKLSTKVKRYSSKAIPLVESLLKTVKAARKDKPIQNVSQFSLEGAGVTNPSVLQDQVIDEAYYQNNTREVRESSEIVWESFRGSSEEAINFDNFIATQRFEVSTKTSERIFNDLANLGNISDSITHTNTLKDVLTNVVNKALKPIDTFNLEVNKAGDHVVAAINDTEIRIKAGGAPKSLIGNQQQISAQEAMVHELVHAISNYVIDTDPVLQRKLNNLFDLVKSKVKPEDFIRRDSNNNIITSTTEAAEIKSAQDRYDYIFNNTKKVRKVEKGKLVNTFSSDYLHEFVAFGLTNEHFQKILQKVETNSLGKVQDSDALFGKDTWLGKLADIFNSILDKITNVFSKTPTTKKVLADQALLNMISEFTGINERYNKKGFKGRLLDGFGAVQGFSPKIINNLNRVVFEPLGIRRDKLGNVVNKTKLQRAEYNVLGIPKFLKSEDWVANITKVSRNIKLTENNFFVKLIRDGFGIDIDNIEYNNLLRKSKHVIDVMVNALTNSAAKDYLSYFGRTLTDLENSAIIRVLLKSDVVSLLANNNIIEVREMIRNRAALTLRIKDVEATITRRYANTGNYFIRQARSLGYSLVTGEQLEYGTQRNAFNIVNMADVGVSVQKPTNLLEAENIVDELTSLYALKYVSKGAKETLTKLMDEEYARDSMNGIDNILRNANRLKLKAFEEIFDSKKSQMVKGYTKDLLNPEIQLKTAPLSMRKDMLSQGFVFEAELKSDKTDLVGSKERMALYVAKGNLLGEYVKGIASRTNKNVMGRSLADVSLSVDPSKNELDAQLDFIATKRLLDMEVRKQFNTANQDKSIANENFLSPVTDDLGNITSLRYLVSEDTKSRLLESKNNFATIMGTMESSIRNKVESRVVNKELLQVMKNDFTKNVSKDPNAFVTISKFSTDPRLREIWRLLPKDTKRDMVDIWGDGDIQIREKFLDLAFGYRKMSVINGAKIQEILKSPALSRSTNLMYIIRQSENVLMALTGAVKNNFIIKSTTGAFNIQSNSFLLWTKGVPLNRVFPDQLEAARALNVYQADVVLRDNIERRIENRPGMPKSDLTALQSQLGRLNNKITTNIVHELVSEGIFQNIVEDIDMQAEQNGFSMKDKFLDKASELSDRYVNSSLSAMYREIYIAESTSTYKALLKVTQYSDFAARYTLHKHNIKTRKLSKQESLYDVIETFVNYDVPTSPELQYLNDIGVLMFTKFLLRIQRVIFRIFKENPSSALAVLGFDKMVKDVSDISDSFIGTSNINFRNPIFETPEDLMYVGSYEIASDIL